MIGLFLLIKCFFLTNRADFRLKQNFRSHAIDFINKVTIFIVEGQQNGSSALYKTGAQQCNPRPAWKLKLFACKVLISRNATLFKDTIGSLSYVRPLYKMPQKRPPVR